MSNEDCASIISEYDTESATQINGIKSNVESVIEEMKAALELTLLSIPPSVRKMPLKTLITEYNGSIEKAAAALAPTTPKRSKGTPKKGKGMPIQSYQTASLTDLLAKKGALASQNVRKTPTRAGRLPPRIPTPTKRPKTPTKAAPSPRRL